jgi:DNA recombination protein RmuC
VQDAAETGEKAALDAARSELSSAIVQEAKRIAGKYIAPPYTTDFAVLYLPLEGLYAEVLQLGGVAERVQREYHIIISGPSTFSALLNSLQMGFRTLAIEQRSGEVWQLLGAVKAEFGTFGDLLDKTQQKLRQASDSIESATRKTRTIERRLRAVENIEDAADQPLLVDLEDEPS